MTAGPGRALSCVALLALSTCGNKKDNQGPIDIPPPPGRATLSALTTDVGQGRALDGAIASTATKFARVIPLDKDKAVVAGFVNEEANAIYTGDGGRSFTHLNTKVTDSLVTWSMGADGTVVLATARRQIPKKPLPAGTLPPIDTLTFFFAPAAEKLSSASQLLAPDEKQSTPVVPMGEGMPAVLGPALASVVVELKPKIYGVAYGVGPGEKLPAVTELPRTEVPVAAPYGRPPQLLSIVNQKLFMRPWPKPGEPLATAKMLDKVGVTKTLPQELSMGPDCEFGGWSYKRIAQPGNKTFVLGISPDKTVYFELPSTVVNTSPMACSGERVVVEAINPVDKLASLVTCAHDGVCIPPDNRPFLKPWAEAHERTLGIAMTPRGTIAMQALKSPTRWALSVSISSDGGKIYDLERKVGEGTGDRGRLELGALVGFGERTMMLLSADVTGTTRRAWFLMASDDGGQTWNPP